MNINRTFNDIMYHLQECVGCACNNTMQCRVCTYKGTKLSYKYSESK